MIHEDVVQITKLVTEPLRVELHFEIYSPSLATHPFFSQFMSTCPYVTKRICHSAMSTMLVGTGDIIFHAGEIPTKPRMYIISTDVLKYMLFGQERASPVSAGSWISEAVLWVAWTHRGMLVS